MSLRDRLGVGCYDLRRHLMDGHHVGWCGLERAAPAITDHHEWLHGLGREPAASADHHHLRVLKGESGAR